VVQDDGPVGLDGVRVKFDDERVVSDAGLMLLAALAARLQIEESAQRFVRLRPKRPGAGSAGRKVMSLIFAMALGSDSIDDCDVLRSGRTRRLLGGWVAAPSTLGTFLRAFTFGHVRQLDRVLAETLTRAWQAGAGPGEGRLVIDVDSFVGEVHRAPGDFPSGKRGDVLTVEFTVMGVPCLGLNGGPAFKHNEAFSFQVATTDQAETDRYWNAIVSNGGQESACGWCKDRWGLSWQITPIVLTEAISDPDPAAAKRAFDAMMQMQKIDIAAIEAARRG